MAIEPPRPVTRPNPESPQTGPHARQLTRHRIERHRMRRPSLDIKPDPFRSWPDLLTHLGSAGATLRQINPREERPDTHPGRSSLQQATHANGLSSRYLRQTPCGRTHTGSEGRPLRAGRHPPARACALLRGNDSGRTLIRAATSPGRQREECSSVRAGLDGCRLDGRMARNCGRRCAPTQQRRGSHKPSRSGTASSAPVPQLRGIRVPRRDRAGHRDDQQASGDQ